VTNKTHAAGAAVLENTNPTPHYSLLIEWDNDDQVYIASVPELPGYQIHGATYAEAAAKAANLIGDWVALLRDSGLPVPPVRHWQPSES
jgi:predicted RNase H-like HicB family nuclease